MNNEIATHNEQHENHTIPSLFSKDNLAHYMKVSDMLSKSTMVPKTLIGKPADILICLEMGQQLGIPMMQALQDIAVINGRPCLYSDGLLAVVQGHKDYEYIKETFVHDEKGSIISAICTVKRRNHEPHVTSFSISDAKAAKLWGRAGPWTEYPSRMLRMRSRGFCIRDVFADALRGVKTAEEINDYPAESKPGKTKAADMLNDLLNNKDKIKEKVEVIVLSSMEQHAEIDSLIIEKSFPENRLQGAFKHYGVEQINELNYEQANDFISKLGKEADALAS